MLEILLVIFFCKKVGNIVRPKGYSVGWFRFFVVIAWFGGEFAGGLTGGVISALTDNGPDPHMGLVYLCALVGAAVGVGIVFAIANHLGSKELPPSWNSPYAPQLPPTTRRRD